MKLSLKHFKNIICIVILTFWAGGVSFGQTDRHRPSKEDKTGKPYIMQGGVFWNFIDDDGRQLRKLLAVDGFNALAFPSALKLEYYIESGFTVETVVSFNRYKERNLVNGKDGFSGFAMAWDVHGHYNFSNVLYHWMWDMFEPFAHLGFSYTIRPYNIRHQMLSPSIGGGMNIMINEEWGVQFRSTFKMAVYPQFFRNSNYLHHHMGVIYRFGAQSWSEDFRKRRHNWIQKVPGRWKGQDTY
jgi:hypothetical protein